MTAKLFFVLALAAKVMLGAAFSAEAASPVLQQLLPQGGQRGTEVTVLVSGQRLGDGPYQVLLYSTGIEVQSVQLAEDKKKVTCQLKLLDDCRLGPHALRLRTASGLSNLVTFHVSNLKEISEAEPNNTSEKPQEIATNVVVNGGISSGDIDVFAVDLVEGERLSVEIEGLRLGRTLFDPMLEVRDPSGRLLASNDDQPVVRQDAFISITASTAGRLFVHVRESAFRGGETSTYRLHVGRFPRPKAVFPPGVQAGQSAEVHWLNEKFEETLAEVETPATAGKIFFAHAADEKGIAPTGAPLFLTATAPEMEVEPNNKQPTANALTAPGFACGVISQPFDKDFFHFTMKKGQEWDFRVRARELRSPLDAVLHIFSPKGKYLRGNDDDQGQPDSYLRFKAPDDGVYKLDVEDRQLRGQPNMTYLLEITKPKPTAELKLEERQRYRAQVINIPQGGRTAAMMTVKQNGFSGPLQIEWDNLPAGSEAKSFPLAGDYNRVPVLFTATPEAELKATLSAVTVRMTAEGKETLEIDSQFRQQTWLVRGRNNVRFLDHYAQRAPVAVTRALPYSIRVIEPKAPLVRGGSMELKIVAERDEGFENALAVRTMYNPPGVSTNQSRSIPQGKLEVLIPITANKNARVGEWKLAFLGKTSINGEVEASTQLVTLRIAEPYFDTKIASLTVTQGESAEWTISLEQRTSFEGEAEIELLRLPAGVTAKKVRIKADAKSARFQLDLAKDARVGRHRGVACRVRLTVQGEPVLYNQGYVDLHVDPSPETKTATSANASEGQTS